MQAAGQAIGGRRTVRVMVEDVTSVPVLRLLSYWRVKRLRKRAAGGDLPMRADIEPEKLVDILPHLFLLDLPRPNGVSGWEISASSVRFRLCGTAVVRFMGSDPTGRPVSEATPPELCAGLAGAITLLVRNRRPVTYRGVAYSLEDKPFDHGSGLRPVWSAFEFVLAPLVDSDDRLSMAVGALNCGATARVSAGRAESSIADRLRDGALSVV